MIRDKTSDVEVLSNLGADRLPMGIDPDGMVHITDLLTNAYTDEELAILREYSTNAWDSHKAAGQTRPIEVTLPIGAYDIPSENKGRFLRVQDWGLGLSAEDISEVFAFYGKSTKDDSDDFTGMMGIGGKSGLIPTFGSFTITGVKDGVKTLVAVGRNEATEPVMDLVSQCETDEPNGVTIEVPVPKRHSFARKAQAFFQFWPEGTVLVDGKAPERLKPHVEISPNMWIVEGIDTRGGSTDWIVMGGVPYPVNLDAKLASGYSLVAFVSIGTVSIAISREAVRLTDKTKDALARLRAEYDQAVQTVMESKVNEAKSRAEAVRIAVKLRQTFASGSDFTVKYGKATLPTWIKVGAVEVTNARKGDRMQGGIIVTRHDDTKLSKHDRQEKIFIGTLIDQVLVHGYPVDRQFPPAHKEKLEAWAKSKGIKPVHYVLSADKLAHGWIDSKRRVHWDEVKKIKRPASRNGPYAIKGSYPMWFSVDEWKNHNPASEIDTSAPIFYCDGDWMTSGSGYRRKYKSHKTLLYDRYPNATVVELTSNRVDKFKRDFPTARPAKVVFDEIYEEIKADYPVKLRKRFAVEGCGSYHLLRKLDPSRIDDPSVLKAMRWARLAPRRKEKEEMEERLRQIGRYYNHDLGVEFKSPLDKYPLVSHSHLDHTYLYMNAVYAAEGNNK